MYGTPLTVRPAEWFIAFSMCVLALLKLQDVESFSSMFPSYDLMGQRWVRHAYAAGHAQKDTNLEAQVAAKRTSGVSSYPA